METISESSLIVDEDSIHRYEFICYIEGNISDWYCSEYGANKYALFKLNNTIAVATKNNDNTINIYELYLFSD